MSVVSAPDPRVSRAPDVSAPSEDHCVPIGEADTARGTDVSDVEIDERLARYRDGIERRRRHRPRFSQIHIHIHL
jgi:hypothetical protein